MPALHLQLSVYVREHFRTCSNIDECLAVLTYRNDVAVAVSRLHARNTNTIPASMMSCFEKEEDPIMNAPVRMLMRRGFPHVARINQLIQRAIEMGLVKKWTDDNEMNNWRTKRKEDHSIVQALQMGHMGAAWNIILIDSTLAIFTFIAERFVAAQLKKQVLDEGRWYRFLIWTEQIIMQSGRNFCVNN